MAGAQGMQGDLPAIVNIVGLLLFVIGLVELLKKNKKEPPTTMA
jgi:hypothetical protein